jgi:hypothetical protein
MPSNSDSDDRAAKQARADAIRRARDKRNANLNVPAEADSLSPEKTTGPPGDTAPAELDGAPNYVEFVDRKMRQPKKG